MIGFSPGSLSTGGIERTRLPAKRARRDIEGALYARRKALADLMRSPALGQGDIGVRWRPVRHGSRLDGAHSATRART